MVDVGPGGESRRGLSSARSIVSPGLHPLTAGANTVSLLLFVVALLAKTAASTLPAAILLVVAWKEKRLTRRPVLAVLPFLAWGDRAAGGAGPAAGPERPKRVPGRYPSLVYSPCG